jgi:hypothetical protein
MFRFTLGLAAFWQLSSAGGRANERGGNGRER